MKNLIQIPVNKIEDVKFLIRAKYGSIPKFCEEFNLPFHPTSQVLTKKNFKHRHIKNICVALNLDIEKIERWKDV